MPQGERIDRMQIEITRERYFHFYHFLSFFVSVLYHRLGALSTPNHTIEEKFIDKSFCLFIVAKVNASEQMCGIIHQLEILNCFHFHRLAYISEEMPEKNEWEEQDFQNNLHASPNKQVGKLDEVHPPLTPQFFMDERQNDVSGKDT